MISEAQTADSPDYPLCTGPDGLQILVSLQYGEFGVTHLDGVELRQTGHLIAPVPIVRRRRLKKQPDKGTLKSDRTILRVALLVLHS